MKCLSRPRQKRAKDRGFILVAVLIVIMLASMVVVSLLFRLRAEETATAAGNGSEQAWAVAMSGVYAAMNAVAKAPAGSTDWEDNPTLFREHLLFDDGVDQWFYSVYGQGDSERDDVRFGLTDEARKLNINQATEEMLEKLPKMTPYLAQGLLDYIDQDDTPRPEGAEQEYYDALPTPYQIRNGPLATLDELLLVRGFTPALVYGEDANWNFKLDANEDDGDAQFPPDNKDGKLDCGLRQYLTVLSYELDRANDGTSRIDLNGGVLPTNKTQVASEELPASLIAYLEAARRNNVKLQSPADLLEAKAQFKDPAGKPVELESGIGKAELPLVLDRFTARTNQNQPGLINVNTASSPVLQTIPGVDEALADSIVSARRNLRPEQRGTPAWLYQEGVVDAAQFKKMFPYLTARAFQYHFHVLAYGVPSGRYRVVEAVIDTATPQPTVAYLRDITRLGLPFPVGTNTDSELPTPSPSSTQINSVSARPKSQLNNPARPSKSPSMARALLARLAQKHG